MSMPPPLIKVLGLPQSLRCREAHRYQPGRTNVLPIVLRMCQLLGPIQGRPKTPTMSPSTIVFDLDGTLVDTAPDLVATLNHILMREGLGSLPYDAARNMVG